MLRLFRAEDAARCCDLINACLPQMDGMNEDARLLVLSKNVSQTLQTELTSCFTVVFDHQGLVTGIGALYGDEIKRVYVDPSRQRQGIGAAIVRRLEAEAVRRDLPAVRVQSSPNAESFYRWLGYERLNDEVIASGAATFTVVNMARRLAGDGRKHTASSSSRRLA